MVKGPITLTSWLKEERSGLSGHWGDHYLPKVSVGP